MAWSLKFESLLGGRLMARMKAKASSKDLDFLWFILAILAFLGLVGQ
jgi:hypothetical protein